MFGACRIRVQEASITPLAGGINCRRATSWRTYYAAKLGGLPTTLRTGGSTNRTVLFRQKTSSKSTVENIKKRADTPHLLQEVSREVQRNIKKRRRVRHVTKQRRWRKLHTNATRHHRATRHRRKLQERRGKCGGIRTSRRLQVPPNQAIFGQQDHQKKQERHATTSGGIKDQRRRKNNNVERDQEDQQS